MFWRGEVGGADGDYVDGEDDLLGGDAVGSGGGDDDPDEVAVSFATSSVLDWFSHVLTLGGKIIMEAALLYMLLAY